MKRIVPALVSLLVVGGAAFYFFNRPTPLEKGKKFLGAGDVDGAVEIFSRALEKSRPDEEGLRVELARAYLLKGALESAQEQFKLILEKFPKNAYAHMGAGFLYMAQGYDQFAAESFEKAKQLDLHDQRAGLGLAGLCAYRGDFKRAEAEYRAVLAAAPSEHAALAGLGQALAAQGLYTEAAAAYDQALASFPQDTSARLGLARALHKSGQWERAEKEIEKILNQSKTNAPARLLLGDIRRAQGRADEARALYAAVYNENPRGVLAGTRLALLTAESGDVAGAKTRLDILAEALPKPEAGLPAFASLPEVEDLLAARDYTRQAHVEFALTRGRLAALQKQYPEAEQEILRALQISPTDLAALRAMAELAGLRKAPDDRLKWARRAAEAYPSHPDTLKDLEAAEADASRAPKPAAFSPGRGYRSK